MRLGILTALSCSAGCDDYEADRECTSGARRPCGTELGACRSGTQVCDEGIWGQCTAAGPSEEVCDGTDNDCDGDIDEGYGVGSECTLSAGCPGRVACADGGAAICQDDPNRRSRERCDGVDNDCDGWIDGYLVGSELMSACECQRRPLRVLSFTDGSAGASTTCTVTSGTVRMDTELDCSTGGYSLCTAEALDWKDFDVALGGRSILEVSFDVEADVSLPVALNLWYEGKLPAGHELSPRKYLPLLAAGDAPGSYVRRFPPEAACFPKWMETAYGCKGDRVTADCGLCSEDDTCGYPTGSCDQVNFTRPRMQLALEFCGASAAKFSASVQIREIALLSLGCVLGEEQ